MAVFLGEPLSSQGKQHQVFTEAAPWDTNTNLMICFVNRMNEFFPLPKEWMLPETWNPYQKRESMTISIKTIAVFFKTNKQNPKHNSYAQWVWLAFLSTEFPGFRALWVNNNKSYCFVITFCLGLKIILFSPITCLPKYGLLLNINPFSAKMMICCHEGCQKTEARHQGSFPKNSAETVFSRSGLAAVKV